MRTTTVDRDLLRTSVRYKAISDVNTAHTLTIEPGRWPHCTTMTYLLEEMYTGTLPAFTGATFGHALLTVLTVERKNGQTSADPRP